MGEPDFESYFWASGDQEKKRKYSVLRLEDSGIIVQL
jgi:hypothetical protein